MTFYFKENEKNSYLPSCFGIEKERAEDLAHEMELVIHKLMTPTRNHRIEFCQTDVLKPFLELGKTDEEKCFLAYIAGRETIRLEYSSEDIEF